MKKIYALLLSMLAVVFLVPSQKANAQYTCSSYSVMTHMDAYSEISSNEITEIEPKAGDFFCSNEYGVVSNDITLPFQFRFANIVTNKFKVIGNSGSVIASGSDSWPDNIIYDIYGSYFGTAYSSQQNSGGSTCLGSYGYYANNQICAWASYLYQGLGGVTKHYYQISGSAPFRKCIVQTVNAVNYSKWYDAYANTTAYQAQEHTGSWQIVIYEGSSFISKFQINYAPRINGNAWNEGALGNYYVWVGMKGASGSGNNLMIDGVGNYTTAGQVPTVYTNSSNATNYGQPMPQVRGFVFAIRYPYNIGWREITNPANQSIVLVNAPLTPRATISNEGQNQVSTAINLNAKIQRVGDPVSYDVTTTATGTQIPAPLGGIGTEVTWPSSYTPTQYGIYIMTMTISNSQDLYSADNVITDTFIVSPPNNIAAIMPLSPPNSASVPIGYPLPISFRFRNIGALSQTNVPITAYIVNPLGQVVFRDTLIVGSWPSGYTLDTAFLNSYIPTLKGTYRAYGVAVRNGSKST